MDRARIHEGVRRMRFEDILGRSERSELSQMEAAELLGISERTFRRWRDRHRESGLAGLEDRRLAPSLRRAPVAEIERMLGLYRDLYRGFTVQHFHEQLHKRHNYTLGYTVTKLHLQREGLVQRAKKRSAHRKKRPRRPMVGMMLHQDASTHAWLPGDVRKYDLVVTMEDATSTLYSAFLVDEEGTASSLRGLGEVVAAHGLFCSLYTDRGSHYFFAPEAGGKVSKTVLTQVGRALKQLGIEHIAAYSPQARGRSERATEHAKEGFHTLQDRLPKELKPRSAKPAGRQRVAKLGRSNWQEARMTRIAARSQPDRESVLWPVQTACPFCGRAMWMRYENHRTLETLSGRVRLRLKIRRCEQFDCAHRRRPYRPEAEAAIALPEHEFGLDVIALVGVLRHRDHRSVPEIHQV